MILQFRLSDGSKLFISRESSGIRIENFTTEPSQCVWAHNLTAEQSSELIDFLMGVGF